MQLDLIPLKVTLVLDCYFHYFKFINRHSPVAVLSESNQEVAIALNIPGGGVSQIMFSPEGRRLYTASIMVSVGL